MGRKNLRSNAPYDFEDRFIVESGAMCVDELENTEAWGKHPQPQETELNADPETDWENEAWFDDAGLLGGYFDDDGNRLDPDAYLRPTLCLFCSHADVENSDIEILCNLTRLDQRHEETFICDSFTPAVGSMIRQNSSSY
ncbi:MAG: hypothetical protein QHI48_11745 [Bacteroidota bacterium]|nr:hypothetical protein [Bacteroidota bacterium]